MIISSTPLRISFFGGGSDIPQYYNKKPGMVISTSINKKIHIAFNRCEPKHIRAVYSEMEVVDHVDELKHDRIRETLKEFGLADSIEICSFSDVSTRGTGLGSSSAFTVGLINAMKDYGPVIFNKKDLAEMACYIEMERCGEPIGKQDQYAAAYGGFNVIRFDSTGVEVAPIGLGSSSLFSLNNNLLCYSTGLSRSASDILADQVNNITTDNRAFDTTSKMVDLAEQALVYLKKGKIDDFGALMHDAWTFKKTLSARISTPHIDEMYETARKAGALGGKILGAGGGGYMLLYVPRGSHNNVCEAMMGYKPFNFFFTEQGSAMTYI